MPLLLGEGTIWQLQGIAAFLQHYERPDVKSHVTKSRVIITRQMQDIVGRAFADCVHTSVLAACSSDKRLVMGDQL